MTNPIVSESEADELDAGADAVIEACGGDARAAVKALIVERALQEQRIDRLAAALSFGYVRGFTKILGRGEAKPS